MKKQGSGAIINVSSVAGHIPLPFHAIYSATKFAMNALGKAARVELKGNGIQVMTVCPGYVRTEFGANALKGNERKQVRPTSVRGIPAERVANALFSGYRRNKREVIVPWTMHPMVKLSPSCFPEHSGDESMGSMAEAGKVRMQCSYAERSRGITLSPDSASIAFHLNGLGMAIAGAPWPDADSIAPAFFSASSTRSAP